MKQSRITPCGVEGCLDRYSTRHRFPHPDKKQELCKLWVQLTGNKHLQSLPLISVYKSHVICHQHFRGEDCKQKSKFLLATATPSLHLPGKLKVLTIYLSASALNNELLSTYCKCKCEKLLKITKTGIKKTIRLQVCIIFNAICDIL